jgi:hypothetical protein
MRMLSTHRRARCAALVAVAVGLAAPAAAAPKAPAPKTPAPKLPPATAKPATAKGLTVDDMLAMKRASDPVVSPDGKLVAFAVRETDVEANRGRYDIYVAATDGSSTTRLTSHPENDEAPQWSPDGK